jgi:hypothetical protein
MLLLSRIERGTMKLLLLLVFRVYLKVWSVSVKKSMPRSLGMRDPCSDMSFSIYLLGLAKRHAGHAVVGATDFLFLLLFPEEGFKIEE